MRFEWDPNKARTNRRKHGLTFEQATELFTGDADFLELCDVEHSGEEDRLLAVGPTRYGIIVVAYVEREPGILRIVSARVATAHERRLLLDRERHRHG